MRKIKKQWQSGGFLAGKKPNTFWLIYVHDWIETFFRRVVTTLDLITCKTRIANSATMMVEFFYKKYFNL